MIYCFDLDGTICTPTWNNSYEIAEPLTTIINEINILYDEGHTIKIYTARGGNSKIDWSDLTEEQLKKWGVKYHELIMGKPAADIYVDDKGMTPTTFLYTRS